MKSKVLFLFLVLTVLNSFAQKYSLQLGDSYADDQLYISISYSQLDKQPSTISKSNFSYSLSAGFIKDIILNKQGSISFAAGIGFEYDYFNHKLKVDEVNKSTIFDSDNTITNNVFKTYNLELPLEFRWRTSNAKKYNFWRVYTGVKLIYNLQNTFSYTDANQQSFKYSNIEAYNKLQYGLTLSAGYDKFNIHLFYGLSPVFKDANINGESIDTRILKFGLIYYFL
ncbi:porin family protein [Polaribacter sp.]|uniref:porin family protein n=1 Tax=Polaribacter sp. TaxID=1920175 RepID=UPI003F6A94D6